MYAPPCAAMLFSTRRVLPCTVPLLNASQTDASIATVRSAQKAHRALRDLLTPNYCQRLAASKATLPLGEQEVKLVASLAWRLLLQ